MIDNCISAVIMIIGVQINKIAGKPNQSYPIKDVSTYLLMMQPDQGTE